MYIKLQYLFTYWIDRTIFGEITSLSLKLPFSFTSRQSCSRILLKLSYLKSRTYCFILIQSQIHVHSHIHTIVFCKKKKRKNKDGNFEFRENSATSKPIFHHLQQVSTLPTFFNKLTILFNIMTRTNRHNEKCQISRQVKIFNTHHPSIKS